MPPSEPGMKAHPLELETYGLGLTRGALIQAIAWHVQRAKTSVLIGQADAMEIAVETSRVVGEFINWVEHLRSLQVQQLSLYLPAEVRILMEKKGATQSK